MPPLLRLPARLTLTIRPSRCLPPTIKSLSHHRNSSSEPHYDPPGGWLFGVPPGEKYKKEGWENIWMYGFFGSFAVAIVGYIFKPDTS